MIDIPYVIALVYALYQGQWLIAGLIACGLVLEGIAGLEQG